MTKSKFSASSILVIHLLNRAQSLNPTSIARLRPTIVIPPVKYTHHSNRKD